MKKLLILMLFICSFSLFSQDIELPFYEDNSAVIRYTDFTLKYVVLF